MITTLLCLVIGIHDGDTLQARCDGAALNRPLHIKLAGVDAPERYQPYGHAARERLAALCYGQLLQVPAPAGTGPGPVHATSPVECRGQDVAAELLRAGLAWAVPAPRPAPGRSSGPLHQIEAQARSAGSGLWRDLAPVAPWEWRRRGQASAAP